MSFRAILWNKTSMRRAQYTPCIRDTSRAPATPTSTNAHGLLAEQVPDCMFRLTVTCCCSACCGGWWGHLPGWPAHLGEAAALPLQVGPLFPSPPSPPAALHGPTAAKVRSQGSFLSWRRQALDSQRQKHASHMHLQQHPQQQCWGSTYRNKKTGLCGTACWCVHFQWLCNTDFTPSTFIPFDRKHSAHLHMCFVVQTGGHAGAW